MAAHITSSAIAVQIPDESQRRGQLVLRTLPILLIPVFVGVVFALLIRFVLGVVPVRNETGSPNFVPVLIALVTIAIFFTAVIALVRLGRSNLSTLLLVSTWTLITTVLAVQDGVTAIWPAMLVVPICAAGLLIDFVASISLAALAILLVASLGWLQWQGIGFTTASPLPVEIAPIISASFWISLFCTTAALTSLLSRGLQRSLRQSRAQAQALSELSAQLEERVAAQTDKLLSKEREAARLEERTRVARDIHDTLAQGLTGVVVQLGAAQRALAMAPAEADQHLELARRMARESLAEARRSIWNLRSPLSQNAGLGEALQGLSAHPLASGITVSFEQRGAVWPLPANAESALLRVGQEALANVSRHSDARSASIVLEYAETTVRLCIGDDGVGFDEDLLAAQTTTASPWGGFGLIGMRERIQAFGGTLTLRNDSGAQVMVEIPRSSEPERVSA